MCASELGNVISLVSYIYPRAQASRVMYSGWCPYVYVCTKKIVIERTRDLIYLKLVATDFFLKISAPVLAKTPVTQRSPCYSAVSTC